MHAGFAEEKRMSENVSNLGREMNQTRGAQKTPKRKSIKKRAQRYVIVKLSKAKDKERILKAG